MDPKVLYLGPPDPNPPGPKPWTTPQPPRPRPLQPDPNHPNPQPREGLYSLYSSDKGQIPPSPGEPESDSARGRPRYRDPYRRRLEHTPPF
ncbi:E1^E4-1 [Capra hircus papillomavirus type 2]|uniref:E1^E4-1 n=1 Tax=Capra hircus papillomavirus type 2 TaxID=485388 RepID=A0A6G7AB88_9PAPI|nr:E1^E4-1 [Capra hircus papillomavirus type 2]